MCEFFYNFLVSEDGSLANFLLEPPLDVESYSEEEVSLEIYSVRQVYIL